MQFELKLDEGASFIIDRLHSQGFKAYCVGGFVRDSILNIESSDIDITTQATAQEIKEVFYDCKFIDIAERYGTIVIVVDGKSYEVTSHRNDGEYIDGRRPSRVSFSRKLKDDLKRRDFTINAMAYSERSGLVDYFGGLKDLENSVLRTVGSPYDRLEEDYLRMLRAIRFSCKYRLEMEANLQNAIREKAHKIKMISAERINAEFSKMLLEDEPSRALLSLYENGLLQYIIKDLHDCYGYSQETIHHQYDLFHHIMKVVDATPADLEIRLAAVFHDLGKLYTKFIASDGQAHFYGHDKKSEELCIYYLKNLRYDKKTIDRVSLLVRKHMESMNPYTEKSVNRLVRKIGPDLARKLFYLQKADVLATNNPEFSANVDRAVEILEDILIENKPIFRRQLAINGRDVIRLGYEEGKQVGKILEIVNNLVADGELDNDKESILKYIKKRSFRNEEDNSIRYMP